MPSSGKILSLILLLPILWIGYVHFYPSCNSYQCEFNNATTTAQIAKQHNIRLADTVHSASTSDSQVYDPNTGIDSAISRVSEALRAPTPSQLLTQMTDDVVLLNHGGTEVAAQGKPAVSQWLKEHWGASRQYISKRYVIHFGFWYLDTNGYEPSQHLSFKLFKYDSNGKRTLQDGKWQIFAIEP